MFSQQAEYSVKFFSHYTLNVLEDMVNEWNHRVHAKVVNTLLQTVVDPERNALKFIVIITYMV